MNKNRLTPKSWILICMCILHALMLSDLLANETSVLVAPNDAKIKYNGTLHTVINETSAELYRFSQDYLDNGEDGTFTMAKARTQSGVSVNFKTNSPLIKLKFAELEDSEIRDRRFSVFKDGALAFDNISDLEFTVDNSTEEDAQWEVYLPYFSGVKFLGLELSEGKILSDLPVEDKPLYMAIGDSITHGVGQNGAIETYPYHVARHLDFQLVNLGIGGSRISPETIRNLSGQTPELVTVLWGYNDVNQDRGLSEAIADYEDLVENLCTQYPDTDVLCIMQTFTTTVEGSRNDANTIELLRSLTLTAVENLQATHSNLYLIDGEDFVSSEEDLADHVHLNADGAKALAKGIVGEYLENILERTDVSVNSLADLREAVQLSEQRIVMEPGDYNMDDLSSGIRNIVCSGSSNIIDLTGVYISSTVGTISDRYIIISGNNNTFKGMELEDVYISGLTEVTDFSAYNQNRNSLARGLRGAPDMHVSGDGNLVIDVKLTVRGSYPYGYGSMYGVGSNNVYGLDKRCGLLIVSVMPSALI
ncbi:SGNH/GDSL hydrolase family protein [Puniceicoccaceae bacterium K14]|nr:SGNH/GDSL hydrolase family protein [Puniceicoccaceae bacterium K14]